ncbi:MAG: hypothetical protein GY754_03650 [bacterium]|nr:hypothetical protein [bacterium]
MIKNVNALENLTAVNGWLEIIANDSLENLYGFRNVRSIDIDLKVEGNNSLTSLDLNSLRTIEDNLVVKDNPVLPNY